MQATETVLAKSIETTTSELIIRLSDREVRIPSKMLGKACQCLGRQHRLAELSPGGYGIHWPLIDEDLFIGGLVKIRQ